MTFYLAVLKSVSRNYENAFFAHIFSKSGSIDIKPKPK